MLRLASFSPPSSHLFPKKIHPALSSSLSPPFSSSLPLSRSLSGKKKIKYSVPLLDKDTEEIVAESVREGRLVLGGHVREFERKVADYCGRPHAVAVTSGTTALSLSLNAMGVGREDVCVVPAYTWVATYNVAALGGGDVLLGDVDDRTYGMTPKLAERALVGRGEGGKKVAIPVQMFGLPVEGIAGGEGGWKGRGEGSFDMVLGDSCCAFSTVRGDGKMCGSWFDVECFSFHPRKVITTGEGGMVVCTDDEFADRLRILRDHGAYRSAIQKQQTKEGGPLTPDFITPGFNYRLTEMQGAMGVDQMNKIPHIAESRRRIGNIYNSSLSDLAFPSPLGSPLDVILKLPPGEELGGELGERVMTQFPVQVRSQRVEYLLGLLKEGQEAGDPFFDRSPLSSSSSSSSSYSQVLEDFVTEIQRLKAIRVDLMKELVDGGVMVRPPMISLLTVPYIQQSFQQQSEGVDLSNDLEKARLFPRTYLLAELTFGLPLHPLMGREDAERVVDRVRRGVRGGVVERAVRLAEGCPDDFTIQYPVRREYFMENYSVASGKKAKRRGKDQPAPPPSTSYPPLPTPPSAPLKSLQEAEQLPSPRELIRRERKKGEGVKREGAEKGKDGVGLYIHVPFCAAKCYYCNFSVDVKNTEERHRDYSEALGEVVGEYVGLLGEGEEGVAGIDIGGGTPTLLNEENLTRILSPLQPLLTQHNSSLPSPDPLFLSMETTPAIAASQPEKMSHLVDLGVKRMSIGVQSTNSTLLSEVNRGGQIKMEEQAINNLKKAGVQRISTDVIFGLPGQTMEEWKQDLKVLVDLEVDSITTYDCLYRGKGRPFKRGKGEGGGPEREVYGEMYDYGYKYLVENGYVAPYGSVNFAKRKGETGTSAYFERRLLGGGGYVGLGNYASSLLDRYWVFAPYTVDGWLEAVRERGVGGGKREEGMEGVLDSWVVHDAYSLGDEERVAKHMLLSLSFGVIDCGEFERSFPGWGVRDFYGDVLDFLVEEKGWMEWDGEGRRYLLKEGVFDKMNVIRALFYPEKCLSWFERMVEGK